MNQDFAIIQGAFLLAEKLCLPSNLTSLQKEDWSKVGRPLLEALREVCGRDTSCAHPSAASATAVSWIKKVVCVVWLKLLSRENDEDVEKAWKTGLFFSFQSGLPDVNRVVLLEAVRSMAAARVWTSFLLHLTQPQICAELERLVQHVKTSPTREEDIGLFLDVWWELWKGKDKEEKSEEDKIETLFAREVASVCCASTSVLPQAAKRLKLDQMDSSSSSLPATDVLHILLYALQDIKNSVTSTDLCLQALSVSFDALYTTFLIGQETGLSPRENLHYLSQVAVIKEGNGEKLSPELVQEAQRDLRASRRPSQFRSSTITLGEAFKIITGLAQSWQSSGHLKQCNSSESRFWAFKVGQSVQRVLLALPEAIHDVEELQAERNKLNDFLQSLGCQAVIVSVEIQARVTATIITHRLDDYQNFTVLFASEEHWSAGEEEWMKCLEKNQVAFQQCDALIRLTATVMAKLNSGGLDVSQCKKLMTIIADIFTALSFEEKNRALADMLTLSSRGFLSSSAPSALTERFEKELNMAFNCIIQGGGGASQGNLNTAVSLVARVAFQNPVAALKSCCHSAIFNKDAFSLMANILQQLHGLRGPQTRKDEIQAASETMEANHAASGSALLCTCLREITRTKSLSANEKEQLVKFVSLLMDPVITVDGDEKKQSFLSPPEVMNNFVLPGISALGHSSFDIDLSLQLLQAVLSAATQEPDSSPDWVMDCSPFPLLYVLAQLLNQSLRCWEQPPEGAVNRWSMDSRELLVSVLNTLGELVGAHVVDSPSSWSRALFWLHNEVEDLDWTVRLYLKPVWGDHFKNEVPSSLLAVCDLPEQEWLGLDLPQYGLGTGLLAWMECCAVSDPLQATMLSCLSLDRSRADHMTMFSKGLLVALTQTLPWCSVPQWTRLLRVLRELIATSRLHAPFSLEYVDFLPLLDLRKFSCDLRLSVLLLRVLQLLCGASCSDWLAADGWAHVGRLYAHAVRDIVSSVRAKLPLPSTKALVSEETSTKHVKKSASSQSEQPPEDGGAETTRGFQMTDKVDVVPSQEVLFVLSQLFCHVQHIQVMMPGGQCEPLFLCSLEILSHYEAIMSAFPDTSTLLESDNTRHFFSTITDNLQDQEMKAVLQQKIAQLVPSTA